MAGAEGPPTERSALRSGGDSRRPGRDPRAGAPRSGTVGAPWRRGADTSRRAGGNERREGGKGERHRGLGRDRANGVSSPRPTTGSPRSAAGSLLSFRFPFYYCLFLSSPCPPPDVVSGRGEAAAPPCPAVLPARPGDTAVGFPAPCQRFGRVSASGAPRGPHSTPPPPPLGGAGGDPRSPPSGTARWRRALLSPLGSSRRAVIYTALPPCRMSACVFRGRVCAEKEYTSLIYVYIR